MTDIGTLKSYWAEFHLQSIFALSQTETTIFLGKKKNYTVAQKALISVAVKTWIKKKYIKNLQVVWSDKHLRVFLKIWCLWNLWLCAAGPLLPGPLEVSCLGTCTFITPTGPTGKALNGKKGLQDVEPLRRWESPVKERMDLQNQCLSVKPSEPVIISSSGSPPRCRAVIAFFKGKFVLDDLSFLQIIPPPAFLVRQNIKQVNWHNSELWPNAVTGFLTPPSVYVGSMVVSFEKPKTGVYHFYLNFIKSSVKLERDEI